MNVYLTILLSRMYFPESCYRCLLKARCLDTMSKKSMRVQAAIVSCCSNTLPALPRFGATHIITGEEWFHYQVQDRIGQYLNAEDAGALVHCNETCYLKNSREFFAKSAEQIELNHRICAFSDQTYTLLPPTAFRWYNLHSLHITTIYAGNRLD